MSDRIPLSDEEPTIGELLDNDDYDVFDDDDYEELDFDDDYYDDLMPEDDTHEEE